MKRTKAKTVRRKRASARTKHVRVTPGQDLHIHVLGPRRKEIACSIAQADAGGVVTLRTEPVPEPAPAEAAAPPPA